MKIFKIGMTICSLVVSLFSISQSYTPFKQDGNWGIKMDDSVVLKPMYDNIYLDVQNENLFHLKSKKLFGLYDKEMGVEIKPMSKVEMKHVGYANFENYRYDKFYSFTDAKGNRKFISRMSKSIFSCNPETIYPKKVGDYFYLYGLDSVGSLGKEIQAFDSKFLDLKETRLKSTFIAQGLNKKYGLIGLRGDTLLAFHNDDIDFFGYDADGNHHIKLTKNAKKMLYNFTDNALVPFSYDDIFKGNPNEYSNLFITVNNGKYGLFCEKGFDVLPNIYDSVYFVKNENYDYTNFYVAILKNEYKVLSLNGSFYAEDGVPSKLETYDLVINKTGLVKLENGYYDVYDLRDNSLLQTVHESELNIK
ncbi:MAG: hypothetical protein ACK5B9_03455 [Flavobacteriia bacterium]|jgi:hypothetical protein